MYNLKIKKMKKLSLMLLALVLTINSCASFSRKMVKNDLSVLKKENISMIDGEYEFNGYEHINASNKQSDKIRNIASMLDFKNFNDCDKFIIKATNLKRKKYEIQFKFLKDDTLKHTFSYKANLKNGLLLLDNYSSKCHGIPYLLGGCISFQSRIGLTKDNNFLIQDYYENSGAFLLIIGAGYAINYAEKYKKLN